MGFCLSKVYVEEYKDNRNIINNLSDNPDEQVCTICYEGLYLESFCNCKGSCKWMHRDCLIKWIRQSRSSICTVCKSTFIIPNINIDNIINNLDNLSNLDNLEHIQNTIEISNYQNRRGRRVYNNNMRNRDVSHVVEQVGYGPILIPGSVG